MKLVGRGTNIQTIKLAKRAFKWLFISINFVEREMAA